MSYSNSDSDTDSEISTLNDGSFSITKRLLAEPINTEVSFESSPNVTRKLIEMAATYVPLIASNVLSKKRSHGGSTVGRRYVSRDREKRHEQIVKDYFMGEESKYSRQTFRRRFRMDVDLFNHIFEKIKNYDNYFTQKFDATGRAGLSPLQKMIAPLRMLAYGVPADYVDEYVQIGQSTAIESLIHFCDAIIGIFEQRYLRKPNSDDIERLLKQNEERGFPGMLGSLDCMHWHWSNCPKAWHGMYRNGYKKVPTLILEAVASYDLWIWHAFFGMAGTNNDITVLDRSPLFDDIVNGVAPPCNFEVRGHHYNMGYYLSDGIYPAYATLIQTISEPSNSKERLFAKQQESARKDVERAFGVLQKRWHIIKGPARMWKTRDLGNIMKTCIILHNMIIENEHHQGLNPENWEPPSNEIFHGVEIQRDRQFLLDVMIKRLKEVRDKEVHSDLKRDLIDNLWELYGDSDLV